MVQNITKRQLEHCLKMVMLGKLKKKKLYYSIVSFVASTAVQLRSSLFCLFYTVG
jgi:hypothetical protein